MKHHACTSVKLACALSVAFVVALPGVAVATPKVIVETGPTSMCTVEADAVENTTLPWSTSWGLSAYNYGPGPFEHPRVTLVTPLRFTGFLPDDAMRFFTGQPTFGRYSWDYGSLEVAPGFGIGMSGLLGTVTAAPGFTASRTVDPPRLDGGATTQTVTLDLRLDDPLAEGTNILDVDIGQPTLVYGGRPLVESTFVTQTPVTGWEGTGGSTSAAWFADIEDLEIGRWYRFQATLRVRRLHEIAGSPLYVPGVCISMRRVDYDAPATSTVLPFSHPDGPTGTFEAAAPVVWQLGYNRHHRIFWLDERISRVVTTVSLQASPISLRRGKAAAFHGHVAPATGRMARLQKRVGGVWKTVSQQTVKRGAFTFKRAERTVGTRMYRVYVPASTYAPAATSKAVSVRWR